MIRVSVLYPNNANSKFNTAYYLEHHMPMVKDKLGAACKGMSVDVGLAGGAPGQPAPFVAVAYMLFDDVAAFEGAFGPHAGSIMGDVPNYTDINPQVLISQVAL